MISGMEYIPVSRPANSFQKPVSAGKLRELCQATFGPQTNVISICELKSGLFNNTYVVRLQHHPIYILRLSPDENAGAFSHEALLLRREFSIQPFFSEIAPLIPEIVAADFSHRHIARDYVFQTFMAGELWDEVKDTLTPEESDSLWRQLGGIARRIHAITARRFGFPHPMPPFEHWSDTVSDIAQRMRSDMIRLELDLGDIDTYLDLICSGRHLLDEITQARLLHGDLWPKNVLIERREAVPRIVGLLDSERAIWGDPMAEWIYYYLDVPAAFWSGYGERLADNGSRFRANAYLGLYSIQLFLEAWRFDYDDGFARKRLAEAIVNMDTILIDNPLSTAVSHGKLRA
jgi:aminoglycoside phosphotransferase (APT) family kinase protein